MSEIKVGDTVWVKGEIGEEPSGPDEEYVYLPWRNFQNGGTVNADAVIPDVPGLAALAAVVAEVGAEKLREAASVGAYAIDMDRKYDGFEPEDGERMNKAFDILCRLAAALEVK